MTDEDAYQKALALVRARKVKPTDADEWALYQAQLRKRLNATAVLLRAPAGYERSSTPPYRFIQLDNPPGIQHGSTTQQTTLG